MASPAARVLSSSWRHRMILHSANNNAGGGVSNLCAGNFGKTVGAMTATTTIPTTLRRPIATFATTTSSSFSSLSFGGGGGGGGGGGIGGGMAKNYGHNSGVVVAAASSTNAWMNHNQRPINSIRLHQQQQQKYQILQHQHQHQQQRTYLYLPTSWVEAQERFERWSESAKHTVVHVKLISKKKNRQNLKDLMEKTKTTTTTIISKDPSYFARRKASFIQKHKRQGQRMLTKIRKNQAQWNSWIMAQKKRAATKLSAIEPLPQLQNQNNYDTQHISYATAEILPIPLPLPTPTAAAALAVEAVSTTDKSINTTSSNRSIRERYQNFKLRRKEQYQNFKTRRQEQYQTFKSNRQQQYQTFKYNRQKQYQTFKSKGKEAWIRTKQVLVEEYSKPEWFDELGRPLVAKDSTGRFVNPWKSQSTNGVQSVTTILHWRKERMIRQWNQIGLFESLIPKLSWNSDMPPLPKPSPPLPTIPEHSAFIDTSTSMDINTAKTGNSAFNDSNYNNNPQKIQFTWIGHSTCWIQMNNLTILTDPVFSLRASPFQWLPIGVPREIPPSHSIQELVQHSKNKKIDLCCITHDHYDHLDKNSVLELKPHVQMWVVPLGLKEWLVEDTGVDPSKVVELEWWQQVHIEKLQSANQGDDESSTVVAHFDKKEIESSSSSLSDSDDTVKTTKNSTMTTITCCPASHWASRTMMDRNFRLWCSFAFHTDQQRFFFCGDTGYPEFPLFRQIGDALGPFDLAAIPIGAYKPTLMMKDAHVDPWEALSIHKDLRSKHSVGIHWGTFPLSEEDMLDPPKDLKRAIAEEEEKAKREEFYTLEPFTTLEHGGTIEISAPPISAVVDDAAALEDNHDRGNYNEIEGEDDDDDDDDEYDDISANVAVAASY